MSAPMNEPFDEKVSLRAEVRERAITPRDLMKQVKTNRALETAPLVVERTRWMAACFLSMGIAVVSLMGFFSAMNDAKNNKELIYVRVKENGTWDIDFADAARSVEFLPATIDSLITQWVTRRFQEIPHTVRYDYGYAQLFLAPKLAQSFLDPAQGNAVERAAGIKDCLNCAEKHIEVRTIDHSSSEKTEFGKIPGSLYRSTVFIREVTKNERGEVQGTPELKIVPIHWRLMTKKEIELTVQKEGGVVWLRNNPIGLQIMEYQLLADPSSPIPKNTSSSSSSTASRGS